MKEAVRAAFLAVRGDHSPDMVVADPNLNQLFIQECRARNLADPPVALNLCLLNLRKGGGLPGIMSKRVSLPNQEDFRFASEISVRFLERRNQISLDGILCDPARAEEFDQIAASLAPGFSSFHYRWAALGLRKRKRLRPELLGKMVQPENVVIHRVVDVKVEEIPLQPGLYLFIDPTQVLYVGECQNLRKRIRKHLDHSDNKGLAHWLWQHGATDLHVEYHVLPAAVGTRARKAMEMELIISRKPLLNVAGVDR
jgi:hypothetical protein